MNKSKFFLLGLIFFLLFNDCVIIKELIPKKPSESNNVNDIISVNKNKILKDEEIGFNYFYIKGYPEPHTPPLVKPTENLKNFLLNSLGTVDLNRSGIIRYYNMNNKKEKLNRIFIMIPGIYSAGGTLANLGKSIQKRFADSEVWIWERRANQLEDRRSIIEALENNDPKKLLNIVKEDKFEMKNGNFYQPSTQDISFLAYWGINIIFEDLYEVIVEAKKKAKEVILIGYSLGVLYATSFLANNFIEKKTAGFELIDKVILLDGPPMIDGYINDETTYKRGVTIIPYNIIEGKEKLESGKYYPCNGSVKRDFSMFFLIDLKNALALLSPDELSIEPVEVDGKKLPVTNLAKFLIELDDNYQKFKLFSATFGRADAKHTGNFDYKSTVKIKDLSEGKTFIDWIPFDKFPQVEFNDYREYLIAGCNKYFNMAEWYQPTRILLDFGCIHHNDTNRGWMKKYFNVTENKRITLPFLCVGLSRGLSSRNQIYLDYQKEISSEDFTIVMINDITHLDGDSITDKGGRPVLADVVYSWMNNEEIYSKK